MTREQCEKKIRDLMNQIDKVYHEYNPEGTYLSMCIVGNFARVNNSYYTDDSADADHPLDMYYRINEKDMNTEFTDRRSNGRIGGKQYDLLQFM